MVAAERKTDKPAIALQTIAEMNAENLMWLAEDIEGYAQGVTREPARVEIARMAAHWRSKARGKAWLAPPRAELPDAPGSALDSSPAWAGTWQVGSSAG
jgi:hypothetical protein